MSGPAELTGLCVKHGVTEASGKVSHARHDIVEVVTTSEVAELIPDRALGGRWPVRPDRLGR
jgi:hypothetical protein